MAFGKPSLATIDAKVRQMVFDEADVTRAKRVLVELMEATVVVRGTERTASGSPIYEERPDNPIRLAAAAKVIEWSEGKPKQMLDVSVTPNGGSQSTQNLGRMLAGNPDIADKIISALRDGLAVAQAIPVQAVSTDSSAQPSENKSEGGQR